MRIILALLLLASCYASVGTAWAQNWNENNGKREWTPPGQRTKVMVSHELEMISWPGLPDSTYFKIDVGSITDSIWYSGDTTTIGISEYFHARFYNVGDMTLEWEAVLYQKPGNQFSWTFPFTSNNLDFDYQDSSSFIVGQDDRPDSVWFSYAVYHSSKGGLLGPGDGAYKSGKAFHIYRPKAYDSAGDTVWLDLDIDIVAGEITIAGKRSWFRNAVYPVTIDPTFGYTTTGGSGGYAGQYLQGYGYLIATGGGDAGMELDSVAFHVHTLSSGPHDIIWGLYHDATNVPDDSLTSQSTGMTVSATGLKIANNAFDSYSLEASTEYWLVQISDATSGPIFKFAYDGQTITKKQQTDTDVTNNDYPTLPNQFDKDIDGIEGTANRKYTVYGYYSTPDGAPAAVNYKRRRIGVNQ